MWSPNGPLQQRPACFTISGIGWLKGKAFLSAVLHHLEGILLICLTITCIGIINESTLLSAHDSGWKQVRHRDRQEGGAPTQTPPGLILHSHRPEESPLGVAHVGWTQLIHQL